MPYTIEEMGQVLQVDPNTPNITEQFEEYLRTPSAFPQTIEEWNEHDRVRGILFHENPHVLYEDSWLSTTAMRLGASLKHATFEANRILEDTKPFLKTAKIVSEVAEASALRSTLEDVLYESHPNLDSMHKQYLTNAGSEFRGHRPLYYTFYHTCSCVGCAPGQPTPWHHGHKGYGDGKLPKSSAPLSTAQTEAFVTLQMRFQVNVNHARAFLKAVTSRPQWQSAKYKDKQKRNKYARRLERELAKYETKVKVLLEKAKLNTTRAKMNWGKVRMAVKRWRLAHKLYEAKYSSYFAPGEPGALKSLNAVQQMFS